MTIHRWSTLIAVASLFLSACGGGGDSGNESPDTLYVSVGADITVVEQTTVNLSAEVQSSDTTLTYRWTANPALTITHPDTAAAAASFVAPTLVEQATYTVTLTVTNSAAQTASDALVVTVQPDNIAPLAVISAPSYAGQPERQYPAGVSITLDGSGSYDNDATTSTSAIQSYAWEQVSGSDVLAGVLTNQAMLTFTTPISDSSQTLQLRLVVTDEEGATGAQTVDLTILSASETEPTVLAGVDQRRYSGERIVLHGEVASTVPQAYPLQTRWQVDGAPDSIISSPSSASTFAIAPLVASAQTLTFTIVTTDSFSNRVTDSISVIVRPPPVPLLNDTGVSLQADNSSINSTQRNEFPGQDGQLGQDAISAAGFSPKAGRGMAGFDFTWLNANGDEEDDPTQTGSCVRDNITGLVWEGKTLDGGLHDASHRYAWYQSEDNGGYTGDPSAASGACDLTECHTEAYIAAVNSNGLCGFYDWRLPNHDELMSLLHFGRAGQVRIDQNYFPNSGAMNVAPLWYWTNQSSADGVGESAQNAWAINFASGVDNFLNKTTPARIRLVRAGRN